MALIGYGGGQRCIACGILDIRFRKQHCKTDGTGASLLQAMDHPGMYFAWPGPAAQCGQTGHRQSQRRQEAAHWQRSWAAASRRPVNQGAAPAWGETNLAARLWRCQPATRRNAARPAPTGAGAEGRRSLHQAQAEGSENRQDRDDEQNQRTPMVGLRLRNDKTLCAAPRACVAIIAGRLNTYVVIAGLQVFEVELGNL